MGMCQPDARQALSRGGRTYLISANEGDARDDGFSEESRLSGVSLDPSAYPDAAQLQSNAAPGRLTVTTATGDSAGDCRSSGPFR